MIVHQIWVNESEPPDRIKGFMRTWEALGQHIVYRREQVREIVGEAAWERCHERWNERNASRALSDIARYKLLFEHGGLYVDVDFSRDLEYRWPDKPLLIANHRASRRRDKRRISPIRWCKNGFLWFPKPNHPLLDRTLDVAAEALFNTEYGTPGQVTGPFALNKILAERDWGVTFIGYPVTCHAREAKPNRTVFREHPRWWKVA